MHIHYERHFEIKTIAQNACLLFQGTEEVEGIALNSPESAVVKVNTEAISRMTRLRLLQLNCLQVAGEFRLLPKDLRWLFWHKFPLSFIPKDFSMARLVVLDMQYSNLREVWKDDKVVSRNLCLYII